ncbi:hypothetical protein M3Y94_00753500 [Aphelenchoides besseyi]|nr:hypothetical protein M3Y94_00753500 [Aphelenchoides besseyi]KAI6232094.1 hypothetical protein M3Y95_00450700 [Aphelenchoides besseyi]
MSAETQTPFEERKPFEPPERRWRPWHSPKWQRFLHVARFPRDRWSTNIIGMVFGWILLYNAGARLVMGPDHPLNHFGWERARKRGELTPMMLKKEDILKRYDKEILDDAIDGVPWRQDDGRMKYKMPVVRQTN